MQKIAVTETPTCDLCKNGTLAKYDARTIFGLWAYMCQAHFDKFGPGRLGTGSGQRLTPQGEVADE